MRSLILALTLSASAVAAQSTAPQQISPPQIVTSGEGEVLISPDRARIHIAVETRGRTAAAAGAENARIQQEVLSRLRSLGLPPEQLATIGYNVQPEYEYDRNGGKPQVIGYVARNTVRADVHRLEQVGPAVDAALAAGANSIGGLDFYAANTDAARRTALASAVANARGDAEAMARAAGGSLGPLIEVTTGGYSPPPMPMQRMELMKASAAADTPINPGQETLRLSVQARWTFIAGR